MLTDQKVTYASFVCDHRLLKTEPWLIRLVVGREKFRNMKIQVLQFQIWLIKHTYQQHHQMQQREHVLWAAIWNNSSYLIHGTPKIYEISFEIFTWWYIRTIQFTNLVYIYEYVYIIIKKGMYGLKYTTLLAYQQLANILNVAGCTPILRSTCMWKHKTRKTEGSV